MKKGDIIFKGKNEGVGKVKRGESMEGKVDGVGII